LTITKKQAEALEADFTRLFLGAALNEMQSEIMRNIKPYVRPMMIMSKAQAEFVRWMLKKKDDTL